MKPVWKTLAYGCVGTLSILAITAGISTVVAPIGPLESDLVVEVPGAVIEQNIEKVVQEHRDMQERKLFDLFPSANDGEALARTMPLVEGFNNYLNGLPERVKPMWNASLLLLGTNDNGAGIGSAFVVRVKRSGSRILGYLMTNNHVIRDFCDYRGSCPNLFTLNDIGINVKTGEVFRTGPNVLRVRGATVIKTTNPPDLALIEVELEEAAMAYLNTAAVNVNDAANGTAVYAIGFPNTSLRTSSSARPIEDKNLVIKRWSEGVIEQTINRDDTGQLLIHTADILPGNSGSGLFNREGVVIGVNVFLFNVRKDYDYNGGGCNVPPTARASVGPSMLAPYMRVVSGL